MTHYLSRPPLVGEIDASACWAAALSAWLKATINRPKYSQADLLGKFDKRDDDGNDPGGVVNRDGGLNMSVGFPHLARMFDMQWEFLRAPEKLTYHYLHEKLKSKGHLFLAYADPGKSWFHIIVLYGIEWPNQICYMDPEPMNKGRMIVSTLTQFTARRGLFYKGLFVGWPYR